MPTFVLQPRFLLKPRHCLLSAVKALYVMGGSAHKGNITPTAEFNFFCDPEAAHLVLKKVRVLLGFILAMITPNTPLAQSLCYVVQMFMWGQCLLTNVTLSWLNGTCVRALPVPFAQHCLADTC